jgi:hypothetical protein
MPAEVHEKIPHHQILESNLSATSVLRISSRDRNSLTSELYTVEHVLTVEALPVLILARRNP